MLFALITPVAALALGFTSRDPMGEQAREDLAALPAVVTAQAAPKPPITSPVFAAHPDIHAPVVPLGLDERAEFVSTPERPAEEAKWLALTVREGDSLSLLFERNELGPRYWLPLSRLKGDGKRLRRLHPGDQLLVRASDATGVEELQLRLDDERTLHLVREGDDFRQNIILDEIERRERFALGGIASSLFLAGQDAGLSDRLIMELAGIFAWDIDFALDIRTGDRFTVIYDELYRDGEYLREGDIQAAEFVVRGKTYRAVRYRDERGRSGFYSPDGRPMKKAFIRTPVEFTRISSRFSLGRKHPILNKIRAHKGVDYAAPRGTPVKSVGDGKVVFAGRKGGYGNALIIQHGSKYTTLYAHLKSFRRGIRRGATVSQGQTVAYVGSTGLATGPHLHYEFRVNGKHVDPLSVKLPMADPIAKKHLPRFRKDTEALLARLEELSGTILASAD